MFLFETKITIFIIDIFFMRIYAYYCLSKDTVIGEISIQKTIN